jgi:uncharacterized protein (TIGR02246 family)
MTAPVVNPTGISAADLEAIAALPQRMIAAWAAHDAEAFGQLFLPDGTLILPGVYIKGRAEIIKYMAGEFAGPYKGTRVTGSPVDLKPLGPGAVALLTVGGVLPPGQSELTSKEAIRASWIVARGEAGWQLSVYQNCHRDPVGA